MGSEMCIRDRATVAPVRGPFLEPDSGGTIRHATVRDDLFRRNRLQFWSLKPGPRFTMFLGPRMREKIAPPSLLPLLSLLSPLSLGFNEKPHSFSSGWLPLLPGAGPELDKLALLIMI